jgi:hypothetical protein
MSDGINAALLIEAIRFGLELSKNPFPNSIPDEELLARWESTKGRNKAVDDAWGVTSAAMSVFKVEPSE